MTPDKIHDILHAAIGALRAGGEASAPVIKVLEDLQVAVLREDQRMPLLVSFTPEEAVAIAQFTSNIANDVTEGPVVRYLAVDHLSSHLGFDLLPRMEP